VDLDPDRHRAEALADALGAPTGPVLVVGAAPAAWTGTLRDRWPGAHLIEAVADPHGDAPAERALRSLERADARDVDEVVVVLPSAWRDGDCVGLIAAATSRLRAGGALSTVVTAPDGSSGNGGARPASTYLRWLIHCGLREVAALDLEASGVTGVRGRIDAFDDRPNRTGTP